MEVRLHSHARERIIERGTNEEEVVATVLYGERIPAKYGRVGFRRNLPFQGRWRDRAYETKQVEVIAVEDEEDRMLVITVIVRFF